MIEMEHMGKRLLVQSANLVREQKHAPILEIKILEVSPSGQFFKYKNMSPSSANYEYWIETDSYNVVEILS